VSGDHGSEDSRAILADSGEAAAEGARLQARLQQAETIVEVQKKALR